MSKRVLVTATPGAAVKAMSMFLLVATSVPKETEASKLIAAVVSASK